MIAARRRHPNSGRWQMPVLSRKAITISGKAAEQRWTQSRTCGPQKPAAFTRPALAIPLPWMRSVAAVTGEFV